MQVAITGATGFIGSLLLDRHVSMGDKVRVLTRDEKKIGLRGKNVEIFQGGINTANLEDFVRGVDILYHCAAEISDEGRMWEVNYFGTKRLLNTALGNVKRWVQLSSVGVYGVQESGVITEKCTESPSGSYEVSKASADRLVNLLNKDDRIEVVILRPTNVYGPTMRNQSLFQMVSMIDKGLFFYIGEKSFTSHYINVSDVVEALLLCGLQVNAAGKTYNLSCDGTIEDLVNAISAGLCKIPPNRKIPLILANTIAHFFSFIRNFPLSKSRVAALTSRVRYSSELITQDLGFRCQTTLLEGIHELVEEWQKNR